MIEVKCIGGECHGLSVKIEPQPTYYEVVDPRDRTRRDFYILEVGPQGARLVPEETAEWRGRFYAFRKKSDADNADRANLSPQS